MKQTLKRIMGRRLAQISMNNNHALAGTTNYESNELVSIGEKYYSCTKPQRSIV